MTATFYVGAYWGPRPESAEDCGRRLNRCLGRIMQADSLLENWWLKGWKRSQALRSQVSLSEEHLAQLVRSGVHRSDADQTLMPDLGFSTGIWNGDLDLTASISVHCGAASRVAPNSFVLELPPPTGASAGLYDPDRMNAVFRAIVEEWEPEWATLTSHYLRKAQGAPIGGVVVGWKTYVADAREVRRDTAPADAVFDPLSAGLLITLGTTPEETDVDLVRATRNWLLP